jgi:hypothetical protein
MYYPGLFLKEELKKFFIDVKTGHFKHPNKVKSESGKVYILDDSENGVYLNDKGEKVETYIDIYDLSGWKIFELHSKTKYDKEGRKIMKNVCLIPFE